MPDRRGIPRCGHPDDGPGSRFAAAVTFPLVADAPGQNSVGRCDPQESYDFLRYSAIAAPATSRLFSSPGLFLTSATADGAGISSLVVPVTITIRNLSLEVTKHSSFRLIDCVTSGLLERRYCRLAVDLPCQSAVRFNSRSSGRYSSAPQLLQNTGLLSSRSLMV